MQPPREPLPGQCCGNGCTTCVWQVYDRDLTRYRQWLADQPQQQELPLSLEVNLDSKL